MSYGRTGIRTVDGKYMPGYVDMIEEFTEKFALLELQIIGEKNQRKFISLFSAILGMRNILVAFDEFAGKEILTERDLQDYVLCKHLSGNWRH